MRGEEEERDERRERLRVSLPTERERRATARV
jgi:hypothetical protein